MYCSELAAEDAADTLLQPVLCSGKDLPLPSALPSKPTFPIGWLGVLPDNRSAFEVSLGGC